MAGYWSKVVRSTFKDARDIAEDWDGRTVSFSMDSPTSKRRISLEQLTQLSVAMGTSNLELEVSGDGRYADQNEYGVVVEVTLRDVKFPASQ